MGILGGLRAGAYRLNPSHMMASKSITANVARRNVSGMEVPVPEFTSSRFVRRENNMEIDRARLYYWNMICISITAIPMAYLLSKNRWTCPENEMLYDRYMGMGNAATRDKMKRINRNLFNKG